MNATPLRSLTLVLFSEGVVHLSTFGTGIQVSFAAEKHSREPLLYRIHRSNQTP
jgi:hypothetical protein